MTERPARTLWTRREILRSGAALLAIGTVGRAPRQPAGPLAPTIWVRVSSDGGIVATLNKSEMGQGAHTALTRIIAAELGAEFDQVQVEQAPSERRYGEQQTAGSNTVANSWLPLRRAAATLREMLIEAAARGWSVPAAECQTASAAVVHPPSKRRAEFAELVAPATGLPVPPNPPLRSAAEMATRLSQPSSRVHGAAIVRGAARYGLDVRVDGQRVACLRRPPVVGATAGRVDDVAARAVPGVIDIVPLPAVTGFQSTRGGLAVVASSTWAAIRGARALDIEWVGPTSATPSSAEIRADLAAAVAGAGRRIRGAGAPPDAWPPAARTLTADYWVPCQAHVPMEPPTATAWVHDGICEVWAPTQVQTWGAMALARMLGLTPDRIRIHTTLLGGGFGRHLFVDALLEAAQLSRAIGAPAQVVWTREDDLAHGFLRPPSYHRLTAGVDVTGRPVGIEHRIAGPSIAAHLDPAMFKTMLPYDIAQGLETMPYRIANHVATWIERDPGIPLGWWRSVGHGVNAFATECFLDELAVAAGADPLQYRLGLLDDARTARVLTLLREASGWDRPLGRGRGRGVAVHQTFGTILAHAVEVRVTRRAIRVERVVSAVDCGLVVDPTGARAQVEGGVAFALGAALNGEITLIGGRVVQTNFHDYRPLRMAQMPRVETHFVSSQANPTGLGEPPVPPLAPALANAVFAATGRRLRSLPLVIPA